MSKRVAVISALVEGCSVRSTSRLTGVAKGTILRLLAEAGEACAKFQDEAIRNVSARRSLAILDEIEPANPDEALRLCQEIQQIAPQTPGNDDCIRRNQARVNAIRAGRR